MDKNGPVVVLAASEAAPLLDNHRIEPMELTLDVFGKFLHICIGAENKPAKLSDLVPLARLLSTKITSITREHITNKGDIIPCRPYCSQCCRYLIPLTIPEAMRLTEEIAAMAQSDRRFVDESCLLTASCILELSPKNFIEKITKPKSEIASTVQNISDWYSQINLPCPFLLNGLCTIYDLRPIACREHLVTGSVSTCKLDRTSRTQPVQMPISILEALAQLTSEFEQTTTEGVMLPFAVAWCRENPEYFEHTWPASQLVRSFLNILTTLNKNDNKPKRTKPTAPTETGSPLIKMKEYQHLHPIRKQKIEGLT